MFEFKFPDVGEGITEGKLIRWLVKEGDIAKKEQAVAEVETDKAVVEIPSPVSGKIMKLLYAEHDTIYVGKPLILFDDGQTSFAAPEQKAESKPMTPLPPAVKNYEKNTQSIPQSNMQISTPRPIISQPTQQATDSTPIYSQEVKALPSARKFAKDHNIDLASIRGSGRDGAIRLSDVSSGTSRPQLFQIQKSVNYPQRDMSEVLAPPHIRQLARDMGVDITAVKGTGNHGTITRDDIEKYSAPTSTQSPQRVEQAALTPIRQAIAKKMTESWNNTVPVTISDEADVTELVDIRERNKEKYAQQGIKLTYLPLFVKAAIMSLQKNPKLNAIVEPNGVSQKNYYNMGIAVDTEHGLMVPVVHNAETKSIIQLATEIADLAAKAKNRTIKLDEMTGGTFTITSIGGLGAGQTFTQIINYPEQAILGIGRIVDKPVFRNGGIFVRKMVTISVTVDHKMIDGADASRFLHSLMDYLENPQSILVEMK
jgi:pyruvate dehydrogenase E2 component (dihydrolipoamide acetyltransferase)